MIIKLRVENPIEWKIQLTIEINFISSIGSDETRTIYSKSDNM